MLPRQCKETEAHEHVLSNNNGGDRSMHQACVAHRDGETNHKCLVSDGVDERPQSTALVEVTSDIAVAEVQRTRKRER